MRTSASTSSPLVSPISGFRHGAGVVPGPQQRFQAVDQGVFVGPVQRVAGLKGHDAVPALLGQQLADLARREHVLAEVADAWAAAARGSCRPADASCRRRPSAPCRPPGWSVRSVR